MEIIMAYGIFVFYIKATIATTDTVEVFDGDNVTLQCNKTQGNNIAQWLRINQNSSTTDKTYTDGWSVNQQIENRINISGSEDGISYNLHIYNVTRKDAGVYRCAFIDNTTVKSTEVKLVVDERPDPMDDMKERTDSMDAMKGFSQNIIIAMSGAICGFLIILVISALIVFVVRSRQAQSVHIQFSNNDDRSQQRFWSTPQEETSEYIDFETNAPVSNDRTNISMFSSSLLSNPRDHTVTDSGGRGNDSSVDKNHYLDMQGINKIHENNDVTETEFVSGTDTTKSPCAVHVILHSGTEYQSLTRGQENEPHIYE